MTKPIYASIEQLPFVCQLNLPEAAQHVYLTAFNVAWQNAEGARRYQTAQTTAWQEVRKHFEKDKTSGRWVPKAAELKPRVAAKSKAKPAPLVLATAEAL